MPKPSVMLDLVIILGTYSAAALLSSCDSFSPPPSWTIRSDGHLRASQRKEDFSPSQFIDKIRREEGKEFGICLTPGGAQEVADELSSCHIDLDACKNK